LSENPYREMREAGRQERCQPRQAREGAAVTVASGCLASLKGVGYRILRPSFFPPDQRTCSCSILNSCKDSPR